MTTHNNDFVLDVLLFRDLGRAAFHRQLDGAHLIDVSTKVQIFGPPTMVIQSSN